MSEGHNVEVNIDLNPVVGPYFLKLHAKLLRGMADKLEEQVGGGKELTPAQIVRWLRLSADGLAEKAEGPWPS